MNRLTLACLAAVALGGTAAQVPASAEDCYGLDTARVCVTTRVHTIEWGSVDECVHVGSSCTPVSVPVPKLPGRDDPPLVSVECYVRTAPCLRYVTDRVPR